MKLFTKPRPVYPVLLRPGDQLAGVRHGRGTRLLSDPTEYVDADLAGKLIWTVLHDAQPDVCEPETRAWELLHTRGATLVLPGSLVIVREAIEIDPWTYVRPVEQAS